MDNHSHNDNQGEFESRTQKKHYAHSMVDLAHELADLNHTTLNALPISEQIIDAIKASKKITSHIARKRHFQFIGKLLLKSDHQAVIDELAAVNQKKESGLLRSPFLTQWTEKLIDDNGIISQLYASHDHSEIQKLRQLLREFNKKTDQKQRRKLFEHIRYLDEQSPLPII